ncbi:hypothetical protein BKA69DRAFT_1098529 [Paraphysoderma sedebokerense]|nr:hypothetical protein BKA69DRAFT_1098529 [Paraphysoderma sedebokerense]
MAICTFSNTLTWPWSSGSNQGRPQSISVDATTRLTRYRNTVTSPSQPSFLHWENLTEFLPDCLAEFRRCCVDFEIVPSDPILGLCGRGMSICTEAQGRWPYGEDSSTYWFLPYTAGNVQAYRRAYLGNFSSSPRNWEGMTVFHPRCRALMLQCVAISGGLSSNAAISNCGNQMGICSFENVFWPHTNDRSFAYMEPYDARLQRYTNILNPISDWEGVTKFSQFCSDKFFQCVFASGGPSIVQAVGTCGNQMSLCTFNDNVWPDADKIPRTSESYDFRLGIYRNLFRHMAADTLTYTTFPVMLNSTILRRRHQSALKALLPRSTLTLRFRATRDGWSSSTFRDLCDGVSPHFAVFHTTNNFIFTAYAEVAFTRSNMGWRAAPSGSSWLNNLESGSGSISTTQFLNTNSPQHTVFDVNSQGPAYGGGYDVSIGFTMTSGSSHPHSYAGLTWTALAGASSFTLKEIEFYAVQK